MSATLDQHVVYVTPKPNEHVLLLRRQDEPNVWEFPSVGKFEHRAELEPWTDGTFRAEVPAPFTPPEVPAADFQWACRNFAIGCPPDVYTPSVLPALRRFDGDPLDRIMAIINARADAAELYSFSIGDTAMAATYQDLQRQIDALKRRIPDSEPRAEFIASQSRADSVLRAMGDASGAPPFVAGERLLEYRTRLLAPLQKHSQKFKGVDLNKIADPAAFGAIEDSIYADALSEATHPTTFRLGELRPIVTLDGANRPVTRYVGDPSACWDQFNPPVRYVRRILTPGVNR